MINYEEKLNKFKELMLIELNNNSHKGGWENSNVMDLVDDVFYHVHKLKNAILDNNSDKIKEYSADVANMAMMVVDNKKLLK